MTDHIGPDPDVMHDAFQKWLASDISSLSKTTFDLGKFLFTVSSGSVGVFATITKFHAHALDIADWVSIALFTASSIFALMLATPSVIKLDGNTKVPQSHGDQVRKLRLVVLFWLILWLAGVAASSVALSV